jgi:hypothetical protein
MDPDHRRTGGVLTPDGPKADGRQEGPRCRKCGPTEYKTRVQVCKNGDRHLRADCASCGRFIRYLPWRQDASEPSPAHGRQPDVREDGHDVRDDTQAAAGMVTPAPATGIPRDAASIHCPLCGVGEMRLVAGGKGPHLSCSGCGVSVRLLQRQDAPVAVDLGDAKADIPPAGSWWLGYVKGGDGIVRRLALARTLGACWDAILHSTLRGAIFICTTDPPRRGDITKELPA